MDLLKEPWPGFWAGKLAPTPEGATPAIHIGDDPWVYVAPFEAPFTVVGVMIRPDRKILAVSRKDNHNDFGLPGGKIEPRDGPPKSPRTFKAAIRREINEETGLDAPVVQEVFQAPCLDKAARLPSLAFWVPYWFGEPEDREGAITRWVDPSVVMLGSYGQYNAQLFEHLRTAFPKTLGWLP